MLTTGAVLALGLILALYAGGATWIVNRLLRGVTPYPDATLQTAKVTGDFVTSVTLHDVRLTRTNGEVPIQLATLQLRYDLRHLFGHEPTIRAVQLVGPKVVLRQLPNSSWDLFDFGPRAAQTSASHGRRITVQRISVSHGTALVHFHDAPTPSTLQVEHIEIEGRDVAVGDKIRLGLGTLQLRFRLPNKFEGWGTLLARGSLEQERLRLAQLSLQTPHSRIAGRGTIPLRRNGGKPLDLSGLAFTLAAQPLAYRDLHFVNPALDRSGSVTGQLHASGEGAAANVRLEARCSDGGRVSAHALVTPPNASPAMYRAHAVIRQLDPRLLLMDPKQASRVNGDFSIDLRGPRVDQIDGRVRASLYNSRYAGLRARRTVVAAEFLEGRALITLESELSVVAIRARGWLRPFDTVPSYDLTAQVRRLPQRASLAWLDSLLGSSKVALSLRVRGHGLDPHRADLQALATISGSPRLTNTRINLGFRRGTARLTTQGMLDGSSLALDATADPLSSPPAITIQRLSFRHLDVARLIPKAGLATDLSGSGTLQVRGRRLGDLRLSGNVILEDSRAGAIPLTGGSFEATFSEGNLKVHGELDAPAGKLAFAGVARPFDSIPSYALQQGTFQALDLGRLLNMDGLRTHLAGSLEVDGSGRQPKNGRVTAIVTLAPSVVNETTIHAGRLQAALADGRLHLTGNLLGEDQSVTIDAAIEGELGPRETMRLRGELRAGGHVAGISVDSLRTKLSLTAGVLAVDTLSIASNVGSAAGGGRIALFSPTAEATSGFHLEGTLSDLAPLGPMVGVGDLGLDSGRFAASIKGPRDRLHLEFGIQAARLALGPRRVRALQASFEAELAADRSITAGVADLRLERLALPNNPVRTVQLQGSYRHQELALRVESAANRSQHTRVVARVYTATSERRIQLDTFEVQTGAERWILHHPVAITYGEQIRVNDFVLAAGSRRITIDGIVDRRGEQRLNASVDSVQLGWLTNLFGIGGAGALDWEANGSFHLAGPAAAPHATGDLAIALYARGKTVGNIRGYLDWVGTRGLHLALGVRHPKGDSLQLTGNIPLALSLIAGDSSQGLVTRIPKGELMLDATADNFRIDMIEPLLDPEAVKALRGQLAMDAHARGSMEAPELSGALTLTDAKIHIPRLGATYDKGRVDMALHGREIRLTQARIESGGGWLEARGTLRTQDSSAIAFDIQSTLHNFQVAAGENLRSRISGGLHLGGMAGAPTLTGSVQLQKSDLYLQMSTLAHSAEEVELTPADLRVLEDRFGYDAKRPVSKPRHALSPWALDLEVTLAENDWLRRRTDPIVAVELSGKLSIHKDHASDLRVVGTIRPLAGRSFVQILGRRFDVTKGAVNLSGPLEDARMNLRAEYHVSSSSGDAPSNVVITAQVQADTGKLAATLGSIPPMENADIKSYLTTGRPAGTEPISPDKADVLTTGASLAVGAALGTVAGSAGQQLGLDVVQILQDREGGQTLVAGKYVSPPLYLGFRQPIIAIQDLGRPETTAGAMEFEVEYAALRKALLNFQGGGSEFRVFLRLRR